MKKLYAITMVLAVVAIILTALIAFTGNATITNDIAIDQLNGGNEAYIAMQAFSQYRDTLITAASVVSALIVILVSIITLKTINNHRNNFKK
jgi:ABC-type spermidine/putrescine transport system permease subunit II